MLQEKIRKINDLPCFPKMMKYTYVKKLAWTTKWVGKTFYELSIGVPEAETRDLPLLRGLFLDVTGENLEN